jgi:hypothetical protein
MVRARPLRVGFGERLLLLIRIGPYRIRSNRISSRPERLCATAAAAVLAIVALHSLAD